MALKDGVYQDWAIRAAAGRVLHACRLPRFSSENHMTVFNENWYMFHVRIRTNEDLKLYQNIDTAADVKLRRLEWLGHWMRMEFLGLYFMQN